MTNINMSLKELATLINSGKGCKVIPTLVGEVLQVGDTLIGESWKLPWVGVDLEGGTNLTLLVEFPDRWGEYDQEEWELERQPQGWVLYTRSNTEVYSSIEEVFSSRYFSSIQLLGCACNLFTREDKGVVWKEF